jgi:hypothetical protein
MDVGPKRPMSFDTQTGTPAKRNSLSYHGMSTSGDGV